MEKLLKVQSELKAPKSLFNKFGGYKYRSAETILEAVKPLLAKYKLVLMVADDIVNLEGRYYVKATATVWDAESESVPMACTGWAREAETKKGMDESQITGAASSYARKYALNGLFAIDDGVDADSTNTHGKEDKPKAKVAAKPAAGKKDLTVDQYNAVVKALDGVSLPALTDIERRMDTYDPNGANLKKVMKMIDNKFKAFEKNSK
jgi:hypothetical protein